MCVCVCVCVYVYVCVFYANLVNYVDCLISGCTETISKSVCLDESVQLFQNVVLHNRTISVYQIFDGASRQIAVWYTNDSTIRSSIDKRLEKILFLDTNGTIWMKNVQHSDEGRYRLESTDGFNAGYLSEVKLSVLVAPSIHCTPRIESEANYLIALLNVNICGRPAASVSWLGYSNQSVITVEPGKEAGPYYACIQSPSLRCARGFKAKDYCSSFSHRSAYEDLQPKISVENNNILDNSITLQCQANGQAAGMFSWRRNGISITNNTKYVKTDKYLIIRRLNNDDIYDIFTCMESGGQFESDPYNIETSGPSFTHGKPSITMAKEMDTLNVSCLTDCYPLCLVTWSKLNPFSGNNTILSENDPLQLRNVTRQNSGNYTCKVQNILTGTSSESSLSLSIHYGPDKIVLNTSKNIIEVEEFDSIAILCTAECFPPCVIYWTQGNGNTKIGDAEELKLTNISANDTYTCHALNPVMDTGPLLQTVSIAVKLDETLIPQIGVVRHNVSDVSVVLQCNSFRKPKGRFSWMVNGSVVKHDDRYSPDNDLLHVRYVTAEDETNLYTCKEPGSNLYSYPFRIKTSGPNYIRFNPKDLMVKEHYRLNVSCLSDCYPICSLYWFKQEPSSGHKPVYSQDNVLYITDVRREMSGNYLCKVQNVITGAFQQRSLSLNVLYGPDDVVVHTSENKTDVYQFSNTNAICYAYCVPPCLFRWTFSYADTVKEGAILTLVNSTANGSLTCHDTNPLNLNASLSESTDIMEKSEDVRQNTSSVDKGQDGHTTLIDISAIRYMLYAIPVIGGIGAIIAVFTCLRKKYKHCSSIAQVSNNTMNAYSDVVESSQDDSSSQHYWTIVTNVKGECFTEIESDITVELRPFVDPAANTITLCNMSDRHESYSFSINSDPIEVETSCSVSTKSEGYINPIHSDPTKSNEYSDPRRSHSLESNAYIHPVPSDPLEPDAYTNSTPPYNKGDI
ncbi:hypothetical protein ACJMK2_026017 [Sinanodonta woodiana]|uniref:Ig-like domain-containing protein n=1 Tax=Sinanodonta woodiana TaxID=1069815 RepID=A0ABD3XI93_SINWO